MTVPISFVFEQECYRRGIRLFVLPPKSPKLNSAVERAQRAHTEEFYEVYECSWNVDELNGELRHWEYIYNCVRPHQALNYRTPLQFFKDHGIVLPNPSPQSHNVVNEYKCLIMPYVMNIIWCTIKKGDLSISMIRFEYLEPKTLQETSTLLTQFSKEAKIIAGGTDLLRQLKQRTLRPRYLINIKHIPHIGKISTPSSSTLKIGAASTIGSIERSSMIRKKNFALFEAAHALGSPQIRNLATIGGNLCNAAPSAETAPILMARQAKAHITGIKGEHIIDLESFFRGSGKTVLKTGELLTHISIPASPPGSGEAYIKHSPRSSMDIAVVNVAAVITLSPRGNKAMNCFISLGAVASTPMRAHQAENMLQGQVPSEKLISEVAKQAAREAKPISDTRGSAKYRREMVSVLTARVLRLALERARISLQKVERSF